MRTIALVNQKGGVGKSTTAVSLAAGLARLGKRVLLIDLDPQAHATVALGLDPRALDKTVYSVLSGADRAKDAIRPVSERLSILPANIHLAGGEAELAAQPNPSLILKQAMARLDDSDYDCALVDSPPQLGFLNVNSLAWVQDVFIPVTLEFYALHGLSLLVETVERVRAKLNPGLKISGVIPTMVHPRRAVSRDVLAELEKHFPGRVFKSRIRVNVRLVEAPSHGKPIFDYAPDSNGAKDYLGFATEVLEWLSRAEEAAPAETPAAVETPAEPVVTEAPATETVADAPAPEPAPAEPVVTEAPAATEPEVAPAVEAAAEAPPTEAAPAEPEPAPVEAAAPAELPVPEPVAAEPTPVEVTAPAPEPVTPETPAAEPEKVEEPFVQLPPGVPATTPVAPPGTIPSTSTYAQMLGRAGLKPIVTSKPGGTATPPPAEKKVGFGQRLLGKLLGRKD